MDTTFLTWNKDDIPPSYHAIDWTDKRERTNRDYGIPESYERTLSQEEIRAINRKYKSRMFVSYPFGMTSYQGSEITF